MEESLERNVKQIKECFRDIIGIPETEENKDIVKAIVEKTKAIIYDNDDLAITREMVEAFKNEEIDLKIYNNTSNVANQYIIYLAYHDIGVEITKVGKSDLINN